MPVAERPARARDKGFIKLKDKRKTGRIVDFLLCGMLITITSDAAYFMMECVELCAGTDKGVFNLEEKGLEISDFAQREVQKYRNILENPPDLNKRFKQGFGPKSYQNNCISPRDGSKFTPREKLNGIDWDDRGEGADPTRHQNITMNEDVSMFIGEFLREFAMNKAKDALEAMLSDNIDYNYNAYLGPVVFISSF